MTKYQGRLHRSPAYGGLALAAVLGTAACSGQASHVETVPRSTANASTAVSPASLSQGEFIFPFVPPDEWPGVQRARSRGAATTSTTPTTDIPTTTVDPTVAAQARADRLVLTRSDLGPGWSERADDPTRDPVSGGLRDSDTGSGGFDVGDDGEAAAEDRAAQLVQRCVPEILEDSLASSESPTFGMGTTRVDSFADVYELAEDAEAELDALQDDAKAACVGKAVETVMTGALEGEGVSVVGSSFRTIDHPDLRDRGYLYEWTLDVETDGKRGVVGTVMVGLADGPAMLTLTVSGVGRVNLGLVDDFVQLMLSKVDRI